MSRLVCPVCRSRLSTRERTLLCENRHSFDLARQGYVNLFLHGGKQHGDNALMIDARRRFLSDGYYAPLANALGDTVAKHLKGDACLLDVGCGEGYYTAAIRASLGERAEIYAFDISKDALKAAAKRNLDATLFVASAYDVPVENESMDGVCLFFSPYARKEILRVLKPGGFFFMAIPAERHLFGLKRVLYDKPYLNSPESTEIEGFRLVSDTRLQNEITLTDKETVAALFAMTPYYYKTPAEGKARLASLETLTTETDFRLLVYQKI